MINGFNLGLINHTNTKIENMIRVNCPSINAIIGRRASIIKIIVIILFNPIITK